MQITDTIQQMYQLLAKLEFEQHALAAEQAAVARATIEPVPVAERLPGAEDCDEEGICWWYDSPGGGWYMDALQGNYSHWLPHHALPLPTPTS